MVAPHMPLWELVIFFTIGITITSAQNLAQSQISYRFPNAQVLATQPRVANYGHPLRILVEDGKEKAIKYVFVDSETPHGGQVSINLPHLPLGDWNEGHIYFDRDTGTYNIKNTTLTTHLEEMNDWHPRRIEYIDFANVETLQQDRLQVVTHPDFDTTVLIKIASFPWEISSLEQEAAVYQLLHGLGVTPGFLGHVTESGRTIGFITEYIEEVPSTRVRNIEGCLEALRKLHQGGIAHGDAHDGNCLIRRDGSSVLIDFELSLQTWSHEEFERDLDIMGRCIQEISKHS